MISVTDILKLLDQIPIWKRLAELPRRIDDMEGRLRALEAAPKAPAGPTCPMCQAPMKVVKVEEHPTFGRMGHQQHTLRCTGCGHEQQRKVVP